MLKPSPWQLLQSITLGNLKLTSEGWAQSGEQTFEDFLHNFCMSGLFALHRYRIYVLDQDELLNLSDGPCLNKMMVGSSAKKQRRNSQSGQVVWIALTMTHFVGESILKYSAEPLPPTEGYIFASRLSAYAFQKKPRLKAETGRQKDDASSEARPLLARGDCYLSSILEPWYYAREIVLPSFESVDAVGIRIGSIESLSNILLSEDTQNGSAGHRFQ